MTRTLFALFQIIRPLNCLITFCAIIVGAIICSNDTSMLFKIVLGALAGFFVTAAGNTINDIADLAIDEINRPHRPLPSRKISLQTAKIFYFFLIAVSLILGLLINYLAFLIVLLSSMLLNLYSLSIKRIAVFGNVTVSFLTGYTFIFAGMIVGNIKDAVIPAIFAFLINFIREIAKDMEDIEGDKIAKANTLPIKYGMKTSKNFVLVISLILFLFTFIPFTFNIYKIEFFITVMVIVNPILIYAVKLIYQQPSPKNLHTVSKLLKLNMVVGLIAIYIGS